MDENMTPRACAGRDEDLVALAWEKLSGPERAELEAHVASCASCRSEFERVREARDAVRAVGLVAPSDRFRVRLMSRIRRLTPIPLADAGPASRRLAQIVERNRPIVSWLRPRIKIIAFAASAAAAAVFLLVSPLILVKRPTGSGDARLVTPLREGHAAVVRWKQRRECTDLLKAHADGGVIDAGDLIADGEYVMAARNDIATHERCVLVYRAADWEAYRASVAASRSRSEKERYATMSRSTQLIAVVGGRLALAETLVTDHLEGGDDLVILQLGDRTEIWSNRSYTIYTNSLPAPIIELEDLGTT